MPPALAAAGLLDRSDDDTIALAITAVRDCCAADRNLQHTDDRARQ